MRKSPSCAPRKTCFWVIPLMIRDASPATKPSRGISRSVRYTSAVRRTTAVRNVLDVFPADVHNNATERFLLRMIPRRAVAHPVGPLEVLFVTRAGVSTHRVSLQHGVRRAPARCRKCRKWCSRTTSAVPSALPST